MLTVHNSRAICKSLTYLDNSTTLQQPVRFKVPNVNLPNRTVVSLVNIKSGCTSGLHASSFLQKGCTQLKVHHVPQHTTSKRWLVSDIFLQENIFVSCLSAFPNIYLFILEFYSVSYMIRLRQMMNIAPHEI